MKTTCLLLVAVSLAFLRNKVHSVKIVISQENLNSNENNVDVGGSESDEVSFETWTTPAQVPRTRCSTSTTAPDLNGFLCFDKILGTSCTSDCSGLVLETFTSNGQSSGLDECRNFLQTNVSCQNVTLPPGPDGEFLADMLNITEDTRITLTINTDKATVFLSPIRSGVAPLIIDYFVKDVWLPRGTYYEIGRYLGVSTLPTFTAQVCTIRRQNGKFPDCLDGVQTLSYPGYTKDIDCRINVTGNAIEFSTSSFDGSMLSAVNSVPLVMIEGPPIVFSENPENEGSSTHTSSYTGLQPGYFIYIVLSSNSDDMAATITANQTSSSP